MSRRERAHLSPVLADEQLVVEGLKVRVRVVLLALLAAFFLTNLTSYLIGQAVRAEADRDTRSEVANLRRQFNDDLDERRRQRDAEVARQDTELRQLRQDACTLADRIVPRDRAVQQLRQRYGCTGDARPSAAPATSAGAGTAGSPDSDGSEPGSPGADVRPARPDAPRPSPSKPAPPAPPPPADDDDGLVCLPILGCVL